MARIGLLLGSLLAVLVALEVALRIGDPIGEVVNPLFSFHQSDAQLGWIGKAGVHQRFVRPDFAVTVEHSDEGFRRPQPAPPVDARESVLFLGDSFTWGWGVAQGEVYTDWLQRALAPEIAIFNRGVNGFGTSQEYLLMQRELARHSYSTVAVLFDGNDFDDSVDGKRGRRPWFELRDGRLVAHNEVARPLMGPIKRFFKDSSRAFVWIEFRMNVLGRRWKEYRRSWAPREEAPTPAQQPAQLDFRSLPGYPETGRLLAEMKALASRHGARFFVIYCPYGPEYLHGQGEVDVLLRAWRAGIFEITRREGIPLIDLAPRFRERSQTGEVLKFALDGHWNREGHRVAAEVLLASAMFSRGERVSGGVPPGD